MASPDIASGNVAGLLAFLDFMIEKGYGSSGAITPWKSAARQVVSTVEGDDYESMDVRSFDIDEYMERFQNRSIGKYSAESLRAYRQRFRKAIEAYRSYLADPNWRPPPSSRAQRPKGPNGEPAKRQRRDSRKEAGEQPVPSSPAPSADLIAYPFPLKNGQMAQLHLPKQGLDRDDADRLTHFIRALVFDQPAQLNAGDKPEDA